MSDEAKTNQEDQNTDQQSQSTENKTETNMVPSYRLKEEMDKKRTVQAELDELKKANQEREDAELSKVEKLTKERDTAVADLTKERETTARNTLNGQFTTKVIEAGLPSKIAKVAVPPDLSEDNMKDKVKEAIKEFSDFVKKTDEKDDKPGSPFFGVQPETKTKSDEQQSKKSIGDLAREIAQGNN